MRYMPDKVREVPRFLREAWVRSPARSRILANIQTKKPYYIVLSPGLKTYLSQFVEDKSIIVFPGAINEGIEKPPMSCTPNGKTRICIPGIVTDTRRDYSGLFEILESILPDIKHKLIFDFLGFIEKRELNLLSKIQHLEQQGLEVFYSTDFVKAKKFDEDLDKADVLLNNQNVAVSRSGKYGVAKETGMLYNMVRGAKPAIYPYGYPIDKQFEEILLYYNSTEALKNIILGLANGQIPIEKYKAKAVEMAHNFTPHNLYGRLVNDGVEVP